MMDKMRSMASGFVAKILMGLLVLSFAVWGIADIFSNFGRGAVATVGETEIDARDYQSELILEVNAMSNRLGQRLTTAQTSAFGLPNQVLSRMIGEATLNDLAKSFNMGLSSDELAKVIAREPAFQALGKFDRNQMNLVLRNAGTTEDRYVVNKRAEEIRHQLAAGLTGKAAIPNAALKAFNGFSFETRDVNYIVLKEETIGVIEDPTDTALATYFDANKQAFRAPEYRSFEVLKLEPGDIIDPEGVSDEDAQIYYETAQSRFVEPEKRQMQQILFNSRDEAQAAKDKIAAGASFADIMTERNLTQADIDFGLLTREEVTDSVAADALFSLDEGTVSNVIDGRFGPILVHNAKTQISQASPFEEIKAQLKAEIAAERATGEVLDMFDKVEDERAGGSTLKEISNKLNLPLRIVTAISQAGDTQKEEKITDLPAQNQLLTAVFDTDIEFEADPVDINNTGFAWFVVTDIIESRDRAIDEVHNTVIAAWKRDERAKRNAARASEILAETQGGKSLEAVATERNLTLETATGVSRQGADALPSPAIEQVFSGPKSHKASALDGDTQYILEVIGVNEPEFDPDALQLASLRTQLDSNARADLIDQLSASILRDIGYTINEPLVGQVVSGAR